MEAMKKEIANGCMNDKGMKGDLEKGRKMLYNNRVFGFGYSGGKTGEREIIKGKECLKFESKGHLFTQSPEVPESKLGGFGVWKAKAQTAGIL